MNGQLILLLISMLMQNPAGEVFPPSKVSGSVLPATFPAMPPVQPPENPTAPCEVGYGTDNTDGKFCMIIQIHPQAIVKFSEGRMGSELPANVPNEIRNRVEKVIVRIGTGPVERIPPNPNSLSESRPSGEVRLTDLAGRSAVSIDSPNSSNVLPVGGQNGNLRGVPGSMGNSSMGNSSLGNNSIGNNMANNGSQGIAFGHNDAVLPNSPNASTYSNNNNDRNWPVSTSGSLGTIGTPNGTSGMSNNFNTRNNEVDQRDDFSPKAPSYYNPIKPSPTNANTNYATNAYAANPGVYPSGSNRPYTPLANNPNPNNPTSSNDFYPNSQFPNSQYPNSQQPNYSQPNNNQNSPSLSASQQYGAPMMQPPSPYFTANQYPTVPSTSMAGYPSTRPISIPSAGVDVLPEDPALAKDKLLPFLLLFSIVGNVYLGLWMNHLRGRYRQLLSNMRGIPASDLG